MSFEDWDSPDFNFGFDDYYDSSALYQPIENEPMGKDYSPTNFEPTPMPEVKQSSCGLSPPPRKSPYAYTPISYQTPSRSYLDSWMNPLKMESFSNPLPMIFSNNNFLFFLLLVVVLVISYLQYLQNVRLTRLLEVMSQNSRIPATA